MDAISDSKYSNILGHITETVNLCYYSNVLDSYNNWWVRLVVVMVTSCIQHYLATLTH